MAEIAVDAQGLDGLFDVLWRIQPCPALQAYFAPIVA